MSDSNDIHLLDKRRRNLEEESSAITDELTNSVDGKKPMGVTTPLVDEEGFPRADIDVYRARYLRKRLNEIRYDHSNIMKKIEGNLLSNIQLNNDADEIEKRRRRKPKPKFDPETGKFVVRNWDGSIAGVTNGHLRSFDGIGADNDDEKKIEDTAARTTDLHNGQEQKENDDVDDKPPFANIVDVSPYPSPAAEAGLMKNDAIITFGTIDYSNHRNLRGLGEIVSNAHLGGGSVALRISRSINGSQRRISLKLKPRQWSGRGLVGCTFSPL